MAVAEQELQVVAIPRRSPLPFTGVSKRKRSLFYTQLARMLHAGISPVKSLATLGSQRLSWRLARAARDMAAHIQDGGTLASAFARHPNLFLANEVRMIEASELAGRAPDTMLRISDFLDTLSAAQRRLITGMIYPGLCLFFVFVGIPNALAFFGVLPPVWHLIPFAGLAALVLTVLVVLTFWRSTTSFAGPRRVVHGVLNHVPVVGGVLRKLAWARFANTFECLYTAGVLAPNALALAAEACGNAAIGSKILRVVPQVRSGGSITEALASSRALPRLGLDMIAVGEHAGKLSEAMLKFAEYQEEESSTSIQRLTTVLIVVIIVGYILLMAFLILTMAARVVGLYESALG